MFDQASISNNLKTQSLTLYLTLCRQSSSSRAQVTVSGYSHPAIADISPFTAAVQKCPGFFYEKLEKYLNKTLL